MITNVPEKSFSQEEAFTADQKAAFPEAFQIAINYFKRSGDVAYTENETKTFQWLDGLQHTQRKAFVEACFENDPSLTMNTYDAIIPPETRARIDEDLKKLLLNTLVKYDPWNCVETTDEAGEKFLQEVDRVFTRPRTEAIWAKYQKHRDVEFVLPRVSFSPTMKDEEDPFEYPQIAEALFDPRFGGVYFYGFAQIPFSVLIFCKLNTVPYLDIQYVKNIALTGLEKVTSITDLWCVGCGLNDRKADEIMAHFPPTLKRIHMPHISPAAKEKIAREDRVETHLQAKSIDHWCLGIDCEPPSGYKTAQEENLRQEKAKRLVKE
jgi:hypothetical protein